MTDTVHIRDKVTGHEVFDFPVTEWDKYTKEQRDAYEIVGKRPKRNNTITDELPDKVV